MLEALLGEVSASIPGSERRGCASNMSSHCEQMEVQIHMLEVKAIH